MFLHKNNCSRKQLLYSSKMGGSSRKVNTNSLLLVLSTILLLFVASNPVEARRGLRLINNRYEGLTVRISNETPQDHCNTIIHGLQVVLSTFSSNLYEMTEGRASLGDVTIALPRTWRTNSLTCSLIKPLESASPTLPSHITIGKAHPIYGLNPWTQQSKGCGMQGDFIKIGSEILREKSNDTHINTAKHLLREWVKFRWGVFDENGHEGDPLYPAYYRDSTGNGKIPNKCQNSVPSIFPFCDKESHVPEAPTKHNALCMGRSAWDIIEQSEDFTDGRNPKNNHTLLHKLTFRFVQETSPRFVLVVEDTAVMNLQNRWEFLRKAVRRTVVYDVPDGTYMALIVFNSIAVTVAPLSKIDSVTDVRQRIGSSLPRNPSTVPESHKCVLCGIQESIRVLGDDAAGSNIILVTTGAGLASDEMAEIQRKVEDHDVKITPIIYPRTQKPGSGISSTTNSLESLVNANGDKDGRFFTVMDEGVGNDSKVSMMVALMDALLAAVRLSGPPSLPGTPLIIHNKAYPGGISSSSAGSFRIDDSLGKTARFSVYYYDLNHVGNKIVITTPSGNKMGSVNMQEEDGDANVIFVNIPDAERGIWKYSVVNRADSHQGLQIQVTALENPKRKISAKIWTNVMGSSLREHNPNKPIILYAELKDGQFPIIDAQVQAKLQRLGTNSSRSYYDPMYINLTDNGAGDPDITKGDGIYSRYLHLSQTFAIPAQFKLSVIVDDNNGLAKTPSIDMLSRRNPMFGEMQDYFCCGSVLKYDHLKPVASFKREVAYGVVTLGPNSPEIDKFPPSRILDLSAEVDEVTREITMRWTAPGNNYDWGRANHYEAVIASSWNEAKAFEGQRIANLPIPHMVSLDQNFSFDTTRYDQTSFIAIRAIDTSGNRGSVSNIISIWVPPPPTTRAPITTPSMDLPSSYSAEPQGHGLTQSMREATFNNIIIITAGIVCLLVLISLVACSCSKYVSKNKKQKSKDGESLENNKSIMIKTNSSLVLEQDDSRDSVESTAKDAETLKDVRSLSPVQSWAASKLLAEHERRFSVSGVPVVEQNNVIPQYGDSIHDHYPDVTLTGTHSFPNSQAPSTTTSDPPAYQPAQIVDGYVPYPYPAYHPNFNIEDLPPYTQGISSQSSQASTAYTQGELSSQPSDLSYSHEIHQHYTDMPAFVGEPASYGTMPPPINYIQTVNETATVPRQPKGGRKVPPPVAPKPQSNNSIKSNISPSNSGGSTGETKRRNVTQV